VLLKNRLPWWNVIASWILAYWYGDQVGNVPQFENSPL